MFSTKKILAVVGAGAMIVGVAACGNTKVSEGALEGKLGGEITFQTWNLKNDKYTPYFKSLISTYEKEHSGTKINWVDQPSDGYEDKLSTQAASGELPDVVDGGASLLYGLAKAGALIDVSKQAPKAQSNYYKGAWNSVTFKGNGIEQGAYGFPWYVNDGPMYYNTKLMTQCGLDPSKLPATWDDYFSQAETVAKNCKAQNIYMSTVMGSNTEDYVSAGAQFMNADHSKYTFNDAAGIKQLQRLVKLYKDGGIPPEALSAQWSQQSDYFQRGSLVSMAGSAYSAEGFKQNAPDVYKNLAVGPKITDEGKSSSVSYEMLAVSAQTKNKTLALDFAQYVTNAKNQLAFDQKASVFPSSQGTLDDQYFKDATSGDDISSKALKITLEAVKTGYASRPAEFSDANGYTNLQQQAALALEGKQTAKEALNKAVSFANSKLSR